MCVKNCNPERLERVRVELGLKDPLIDQYTGYMKGIFVGRDLGSAQGGFCDAPCLGHLRSIVPTRLLHHAGRE